MRAHYSLVPGLVLAVLLAACGPDSGGGHTVSEPGPLIEVVVANRTSESATVALHSQSADGSGSAELYVDGCDGSWASSPLDPQWWITVNGAELIDEATQLPAAKPGESVVITVELNEDGAQVSDISVAPSDGAPHDDDNLCL